MPALIEGACGEARPMGQAVRLHVEAKRIGTVGERGAGIREELGHVREPGPPGPLIHGERLAHPLPRQPRHGIGTLTVRHRRSVAIADRDVDVVDPRTHGDSRNRSSSSTAANGSAKRWPPKTPPFPTIKRA